MAKVVVGLLTAEQEFQQLQAKDARDTAARLGLEAEVLLPPRSHPPEEDMRPWRRS